ncbi:MAG: Lcl domain-containing protein [Candidatus Electronema sp. VV]
MKLFNSSLARITAITLFSSCHGATLFAANWNPLPDTGQTECYDVSGNVITCPTEGEPLYGQDAQYTSSKPAYNDLNNGTIQDYNTGLVWQKETADIDGNGSVGEEDKMYQPDAVAYCSNLNFGGSSDWRLPDMTELESIVDYSKYSPATNSIFNSEADGYWSNQMYADKSASSSAWGINFADGYQYIMPASGEYYVRCVRGERKSAVALIDQGNTAIDATTELTWMKYFADINNDGNISDGDGINLQGALSWCEQLSLDGYSDWRLPNIRELQSIVDRSKYNPGIYAPLVLGTACCNLWVGRTWSSTTSAKDASRIWVTDFVNGTGWNQSKDSEEFTRCVRGGLAPAAPPVTLSVLFGGNGYGKVHLSPSDKDCTSKCTNDYLPGTQVTLTATADTDSTFTGWDGPCQGTGTCTVTINETGSVIARFNRTNDVAVDVYSQVDYPSGSGDGNAFLVQVDNLGAKTAENIQVDVTYSPNDWNGGSWGWGCGDVPEGITCSKLRLGDNHTRFTLSMPVGKSFLVKGRFTPDEDSQYPYAMTVAATATYSGDSNLTNNQDSKTLSSDPNEILKPDNYAMLLGINEDAANKNTIIFTHGWQADDIDGCDEFPNDEEKKKCYLDPLCLHQLLECYSNQLWTGDGQGQARSLTSSNQDRNQNTINQILGGSLNIWQYVWNGAFTHKGPFIGGYISSRNNVFIAGDILADRLLKRLGANYTGKIHFVGHSLGTIVNAYAVKKVRHDMQNAIVQMTILDHPNRIRRIIGSKIIDNMLPIDSEKTYGFGKDFFVNLLPEIHDPASRNKLFVDNYFSEYGYKTPNRLESAGVGTQITGKNVYNHNVLHEDYDYIFIKDWFIGLHDPNDVGGDFFSDESLKILGTSHNNDHSGVHQWYRWTMWPVKTDKLAGNNFICHNRIAENNWADRSLTSYDFHASLNPCESGFAFSIVQDNPLDFPAGNGDAASLSISPAANLRLLGSPTANYCQLQVSPFEVVCSKSPQSSSSLSSKIMSNVAVMASNAAYIKQTINIDNTVDYMSMTYKFNNLTGTEFIHILIDGQIVWSMTSENVAPDTWVDSGKIPLFFKKGEHELMIVFNGMETDVSTFAMKDLTFYQAPDAKASFLPDVYNILLHRR